MANGTPRSEVGSCKRLPNGRWTATVDVGRKVDGSRDRRHRTFDTEEEAKEWCVVTKAKYGRRKRARRGMTLRAAWKVYREDKGERLTNKALYNYGRLMERYWLPALGDLSVTDIDPREVQDLLRRMTHENALHAKTALSSVLSYCVDRMWLDSNPMRGYGFEIPGKVTIAEDDGVWDDDPFGAIESASKVWDVTVAMECMARIRGMRIEPLWLCCIAGGLRIEESLALRKMDVRRTKIKSGDSEIEVTQAAIHHAVTEMDGRKGTKSGGSDRRIVTFLAVFGDRIWEMACSLNDRRDPLCDASPANLNRTWRLAFEEPVAPHRRMSEDRVVRGRLYGLPYIPLKDMRHSHATLMQAAGVLDSMNAAAHGHSEEVERRRYLRPDTSIAAIKTSEHFRLVG